MKLFIILILFIPVLIKAMRQKKWNLYLMFAFVPILPDTFAIELSSSLPLITASRIIILLNLAILVLRDHGKIRILFPKELKLFFVVLLLVQLIDLRFGAFGINGLVIVVLHQLSIVLVAVNFVNDEETFYECVHFFLLGLLVNSITGILQTVGGIDISTVLQLVGVRSEFGLSDRIAMTRAYGFTIGGITFGAYMCLAFFVALFMYEKKGKKYLAYLAIFLVAMMCSLSRSSIMTLCIVMLVMSIRRFKTFWKKYFKYIALGIVICVGLCVFSLTVRNVVLEPIKSVLVEIGFNMELADNFGKNSTNGTSSRIEQWTLLWYMLKNGNFLLGYGYDAYYRGMFHFFSIFWNCWIKASAFDVGFAAYFGSWGLIGAFNYFLLLKSMFKRIKQQKYKEYGFYQAFWYILLSYIILNIFSSIMDNYIIWALFALYYSFGYIQKNKQFTVT